MKETHVAKFPKRTGTLSVEEFPDRVVMILYWDRYGDFGDTAQIESWLKPIFDRYETDKRPVVLENPKTGEMVAITGDANNSMAVIKPGKNS